jgi:hypothetical protein
VEISDLAALDSVRVHSEDGRLIGQVTAAHVDQGTDHVRFVEVDAGRTRVVVPTGEAAVADREIVVPYLADAIDHAPTVEAGQTLSVGEVMAVATHFHLDTVVADGQRLTDRPAAAAAQDAGFARLPLPPIVFSVGAGEDAVP